MFSALGSGIKGSWSCQSGDVQIGLSILNSIIVTYRHRHTNNSVSENAIASSSPRTFLNTIIKRVLCNIGKTVLIP